MTMLDNQVIRVWDPAKDNYFQARASDLKLSNPRKGSSQTTSTAPHKAPRKLPEPPQSTIRARTFTDADLWALAHEKKLLTLDQARMDPK